MRVPDLEHLLQLLGYTVGSFDDAWALASLVAASLSDTGSQQGNPSSIWGLPQISALVFWEPMLTGDQTYHIVYARPISLDPTCHPFPLNLPLALLHFSESRHLHHWWWRNFSSNLYYNFSKHLTKYL